MKHIKLFEDFVNEGMSFQEIKDKYVDNPYGIGANSVEYQESPNYGNRLTFRSEDKYDRDQVEKKLKGLGIPAKKMSKSTADKAFKYRYELTLFEEFISESRVELDTTDPENPEFLRYLKKNKIKMGNPKGSGDFKSYEYTGSYNSLVNLITDYWVDTVGVKKQLIDSIEESLTNESKQNGIKESVLCEATVEMEAINPDDKGFLKLLKKHKVTIINKKMEFRHGGGMAVITMQGSRKDLEAVLADEEFGWDDPDLAEYIEESVSTMNEAKEESFLTENVDIDKVADLFAYSGTDTSRYDNKIIDRYGEDVVNAAKKMAPQIEEFEKKAASFLQKIKSDKTYPIYLEMINAEDAYAGGKSFTSFLDVLSKISYKNKIK
jgi:hypothetical protein